MYHVMGHVESMELGEISDWLELVDLIVRDPQLFQGFRRPLNSLSPETGFHFFV